MHPAAATTVELTGTGLTPAASAAIVAAPAESRTPACGVTTGCGDFHGPALPPSLTGAAGVSSGLMLTRHAQAGMAAEQEDHVSMGRRAARKLRTVLAGGALA